MKRILTLLTVVLVSSSVALADACTQFLGNAFTPNQELRICKQNGAIIAQDNVETVAGTGTNQATGAALSGTNYVHRITGANGVLAWTLPDANVNTIGRVHILLNTTAGAPLIFPAVAGSDTINGAAVDAVFAALTGIKPIICVQFTSTGWICS